MELCEFTEGRAKIEVPKFEKVTAKTPVFYNPKMEFSRDISVSVMKTLKIKDQGKVLDGLSGSGIRGIRYMLESGTEVFFNDHNPVAVSLIEKNLKLNSLEATVTKSDFNHIYGKFEVVDIDPFGSPVRFLDGAFRLLKNNSYLFLTATDTSALTGAHKDSCRRKYDAIPLKSSFTHELAVRILIGKVVRNAAKYNFALRPILSYTKEHFIRAYFEIKYGKEKTNNALNNIGFALNCKCGYRRLTNEFNPDCPFCRQKVSFSHPLWISKIKDREFVSSCVKEYEALDFLGKKPLELLKTVENEIDAPLFYDIHELTHIYKTKIPKTEEMIKRLKEIGFNASATHFSSVSVKTDAEINDVLRCLDG
ncbi:MAG: tRNA (guanine(26)-N(2))-dimethyltransferase [Candidatus Methanofastidiosum methylothiophilum]|uniref:tRNA (guanine(26)-N(2))-dimethyltransferase n=1 Tax=Candidatus Methanofastidiosum methylothiophilum TaxID=1705564 RepID=A0A150J9L0_9EURY|nr:MAG: tRNA (guanine(26)-N(2))-dimethyltransferase [Candidatus Methanofastidiosum methylthiophilus]NMC76996.1 tRNA (guanine(10)-N(2))-dimethyltransferase [Candidatus Methanofastidiosa archaeon]